MDFKEARQRAGLSLNDCIKIFEVHRRTVRNWEKGKNKPPRAVFLWLLVLDGELEVLGGQWRGFRLLPDCILSAAGNHVWHYEIDSIKYLYQAAGINRSQHCKSVDKRQLTLSFPN